MNRCFTLITLLFLIMTTQPQVADNSSMKEKQKINYTIRKSCLADRDNLKELYINVANIPGGLVRSADEITDEYIDFVISATEQRGLMFVAEYENKLIGTIAQYKPDLKILSHVLDEGSILVDPEYQGMGIGTQLYTTLLNEVKDKHPDILRVNLKVRVSNPAIRMYQRLGFKKEAEFESLIRGVNGELESVIAMTWINPNFKDNVHHEQ